MLIDARLLPRWSVLAADVVIIGAGPAGLTLAETLATTRRSVVLLDAAGRRHGRRDDAALRGDGSGRPLPFVASRRRGFGGSSAGWAQTGLRIRPLDSIDLEPSAARPGAEWPLSRSDLDPYYERAHDVVGRRPGYEPARWGLGASTPLAWDGGPELAMFQFAPADVFTRRYDSLIARDGLDVVLHAQACRLDVDDTGSRVTAVAVACEGDSEVRVTGTTFVLAAGALESSRLLLASPGHDGRSLGNDHDNVGRYFMDRLSCDTGVLVPAPEIDARLDVFAERRVAGDEHQPMLWLGAERIHRHGLLNGAFWLNSLDAHYLTPGVSATRSLRQAMRSTPRRNVGLHAREAISGVGDLVRYVAARAARRSAPPPSSDIAMRFLGEQAPHRESRITLSQRADAFGMRRVHVHWHIDDDDLRSVRAHQDLLAAELEARGVGTIRDRFDPETNERPVMSNFHHLGGTRMHVSARHGVVDADCRVHGVPNLFVVSGSVFPAGGYANPTLTIIALAIRCADTVAAELAPARIDTSAS